MSAINLSGNASGSGTFTIASPNSNTSYTLSLPEEAGTITTSNSPYSTFRNRIINGDMRIDQRNAGASVTVNSTAPKYPVDRFFGEEDTDGEFTLQQDSSAPAGFVNSIKATITTADGSLSGSQYAIGAQQRIEGTNMADLGWGSASAKTVTLSFWVRSSLTGTFGGVILNSANSRSYPFTYTISVADTWEQKSVTIAGDTSGTWLTTTGTGMKIIWSLGAGSTFSGTANSWSGTLYLSATGAVSVIGTLNATWYITGVQLEVGSVATPFERRPYGTELSLCQRYFEKSVDISSAILTNTFATFYGNMPSSIANGNWYLTFPFKVTKRAAPTVTTYPYTTAANTSRFSNNVGTDYGANSAVPGGIYDSQFSIANNSGGALSVGAGILFGSWFASAEL